MQLYQIINQNVTQYDIFTDGKTCISIFQNWHCVHRISIQSRFITD